MTDNRTAPVPHPHLRLVSQQAQPAGIRLLLVGCGADCAAVLQSWSDRLRASALRIGERHLPYEWLDQYALGFDLAFVDADHFGDAGEVIDFGQRLRRGARGLPVIMASSAVSGDDFSTERQIFCDATLKKPLTLARLEKAAAHACENHAHRLSFHEDPQPPPRLLGAIP